MNELVPYSDLKEMATQVVKGGLFPGIKTPEQALTLFLVAQAEGLHPMTATMRYNIIQNRPAMKAEAMLASFMDRGGTVDWTEYTDEAVTGLFRSAGVPKGVSVRWTMADAKRAGVTMNQTWTKYPRQMLKARVASDGVRMCDPSVNTGRYTPEEVSEFEPTQRAIPAEIVPPEPPQELPEPSLEPLLEASLRQQPEEGDEVPETDPEEEILCDSCNGIVSRYESKKGVVYDQCQFAHELFLDLMGKGKTKQVAGVMTKDHYYQVFP